MKRLYCSNCGEEIQEQEPVARFAPGFYFCWTTALPEENDVASYQRLHWMA